MSRYPLFILLGVALSGGCDHHDAGLGLNTGEAVAMDSVQVNLPAAPSFDDMNQPLANPDGTPTVFGLRKQRDKYLDQDVKVKATLVEVYQCPTCPKHQVCPRCEQSHFYLSDKADGKPEKGLMVVDYLAPKEKPPALTIGKQYEVEGHFAINSPTGFAADDGLLVFTRMVDDKGKEILSQAAQLEAQAAAEQAKLKK